jgi:hypothetical protein
MTTKVFCQFDQKGDFLSIFINGHTGYKKRGEDIVCAGISSITNGTINFLSIYYQNNCQISINSAEIIISTIKNDPSYQLCLRMMIYQLNNIADSYPNYLKIVDCH